MEQVQQISIAKKHRFAFIDVLRGIAVLWMVETHVIDVVLSSNFKSGWFYNFINISNGFVAVTFLFCAGAGFWIAATRKAEEYRLFQSPLWQYLRRLGLILLIAYWLHFPTISFHQMFSLTSERWLSFFECDILQTIVYSSLFALISLLIIKNLQALKWIYGLLGLLIFVVAPWIWELNPFDYLPAFFASLFAKYPISKFPLFPWSGYFFAGAFATALFFQSPDKRRLSWGFLLVGGPLLLIIFYSRNFTDFYGFRDWWHVSPFHSLFRISGTAAIFGLLFIIEEQYKEKRIGRVLQLCGQESLYIYVSHLLIVYGSIANFGMRYFVGSRLDPFRSILIIIGLWIVGYFTAYAWHQLKASDIRQARWVMASVFGLFFLIFLVL